MATKQLIKFKASASSVEIGDNGDNAKTAPLKMVARGGGTMDHPCFPFPVVHDFAGMKLYKPKIHVDYEHGEEIGYLNRFDSSSGDLVCSGAIVNVDEGAEVIAKGKGGVPYEASIQWGMGDEDDYVLEFVPDGVAAVANGQTFIGPVLIFREWELQAVAVCKFGVDGATSTEFESSKKSVSEKKVITFRASKNRGMSMNTETVKDVVEAKAETSKEVVEAVAETPESVQASVKAETSTEVVEAKHDEQEKPSDSTAVAAVVEAKTVASEATVTEAVTVDPRAEAKKFVEQFGDKGFEYFASGKSYVECLEDFSKSLASKLSDAQSRIAAVDRGAPAPVKFVASEDKPSPKGMAAVIKFPKAAFTK